MPSSNGVPRGSAEVDAEKAVRTITTESKDEYPGPQKVFLIMIGAYLSMFLVALDRTIIGTAIPKITDDFHSINDVGWYASAYLITLCAFQLVFGRIYTFYSAKWVLLCAIGLFELGVSGPTSEVELCLDLLTMQLVYCLCYSAKFYCIYPWSSYWYVKPPQVTEQC